MTVGELKDLLSNYNDNDKVLIKPIDSSYVCSIRNIVGRNVNSFGNSFERHDYNAVVIYGDAQIGSV